MDINAIKKDLYCRISVCSNFKIYVLRWWSYL